VGKDSQIADTRGFFSHGPAAMRVLDALSPRIYRGRHRLAVDFMKREREENP